MAPRIYTYPQWWALWRSGRLVLIDDRVMIDHVVGHVTGADKRLALRYGGGAVLFFPDRPEVRSLADQQRRSAGTKWDRIRAAAATQAG